MTELASPPETYYGQVRAEQANTSVTVMPPSEIPLRETVAAGLPDFEMSVYDARIPEQYKAGVAAISATPKDSPTWQMQAGTYETFVQGKDKRIVVVRATQTARKEFERRLIIEKAAEAEREQKRLAGNLQVARSAMSRSVRRPR
jgi:hypothetical protein